MTLSENKINIERFNDWAQSYSGGRIHPWFNFRQSKAIEQMDLKNGTKVLDVGCGTGWAVSNIINNFRGVKAFGMDISHGMLVKAKSEIEQSKPNRYINADAEGLPFRSNTFDYIMCTSSFHHYSTPEIALSEFRRVLSPDGKLIIVESCRNGSIGMWLWDRWLRAFEKGHVKYYTRGELLSIVRQTEFKDVELAFFQSRYFFYKKMVDSTMVVTGRKKVLYQPEKEVAQ